MKKCILGFLLFLGSYSYSQVCGVIEQGNSGQAAKIDATPCNFLAENNETYCLNMKFHIVRNDDQTNGYDPALIPAILNNLNSYFIPLGITIISLGYDFVDSTLLNNYGAGSGVVIGANDVPNAYNYYLLQDIPGTPAGIGSSRHIYMERYYATLSAFSAHELAHNLGLYHSNNVDDCVGGENASNCLTCADYVCDTDASSMNVMRSSLSQSGVYTFTAGQALRMKNYIRCNEVSRRSNVCAFLTGVDQLCNNATTSFALNNAVPGSTVTWTVSSNLTILSSSSTGITIQASNTTIPAQATITATLNGTPISKTIHVGTPSTYLPVTGGVPYQSYQFIYGQLSTSSPTTFSASAAGKSTNDTTGYEWEKISGNFIFVSYGNGGVNYAQVLNNGTKSVGRLAHFSVTGYISGTNMFKVRSQNSCGWGPWTQIQLTAYGAKVIGTDATENLFKVYPNPANHMINIGLKNQDARPLAQSSIVAELYDMSGNKKETASIVNNATSINVSGLKMGIYLLKINIDGQVEDHKIVIE